MNTENNSLSNIKISTERKVNHNFKLKFFKNTFYRISVQKCKLLSIKLIYIFYLILRKAYFAKKTKCSS